MQLYMKPYDFFRFQHITGNLELKLGPDGNIFEVIENKVTR